MKLLKTFFKEHLRAFASVDLTYTCFRLSEHFYLVFLSWMIFSWRVILRYKSSPPEVFLGKGCSENMHQIYRRTHMPNMISITLSSNFNVMTLWHECSPVNLLHEPIFLGAGTLLEGCFWRWLIALNNSILHVRKLLHL